MIWSARLTLAALSMVAASSCATPVDRGLPDSLMTSDDGSISGVWSEADGLTLTISLSIGTFAVRRGCTMTGGTLRPQSGGTYRIGRYASGFSDERCGPWRSGPAIAPFDGELVKIERRARELRVAGPTRTLLLKRRISR